MTIDKEEFRKFWLERMGPGDTYELFDKVMDIYNAAGNTHSDDTHDKVITKIIKALGLE